MADYAVVELYRTSVCVVSNAAVKGNPYCLPLIKLLVNACSHAKFAGDT